MAPSCTDSSTNTSVVANEPLSVPAAKEHEEKDKRIHQRLQETGVAPAGCHVWLVKEREGNSSDGRNNAPSWALMVLGARLGAGNGFLVWGSPRYRTMYFNRFIKHHGLLCEQVYWFHLECQFRLFDTVAREYIAFVVYRDPRNASDGMYVTAQMKGTDNETQVGKLSKKDWQSCESKEKKDLSVESRTVFLSKPFKVDRGQQLLTIRLTEKKDLHVKSGLVICAIGISPADKTEMKESHHMQTKAGPRDRKAKKATAEHVMPQVTKGSRRRKEKGVSKGSKTQGKTDPRNQIEDQAYEARFERLYLQLLHHRMGHERNAGDEQATRMNSHWPYLPFSGMELVPSIFSSIERSERLRWSNDENV